MLCTHLTYYTVVKVGGVLQYIAVDEHQRKQGYYRKVVWKGVASSRDAAIAAARESVGYEWR